MTLREKIISFKLKVGQIKAEAIERYNMLYDGIDMIFKEGIDPEEALDTIKVKLARGEYKENSYVHPPLEMKIVEGEFIMDGEVVNFIVQKGGKWRMVMFPTEIGGSLGDEIVL